MNGRTFSVLLGVVVLFCGVLFLAAGSGGTGFGGWTNQQEDAFRVRVAQNFLVDNRCVVSRVEQRLTYEQASAFFVTFNLPDETRAVVNDAVAHCGG